MRYSITCLNGARKHIYVYPQKQSFQYVSSKSHSFNSLDEAVANSCSINRKRGKYKIITDGSLLCKNSTRIKKTLSSALAALETIGNPKKYNCAMFQGNQKVRVIKQYSNGVTKVKVSNFGIGFVRTSDFKQ